MPRRAARSKPGRRADAASTHEVQPAHAKKLHLNIPEEIHQRLRVKCALDGCTMQDFVSQLIADAVSDVLLVSPGEKGAVFSLTAVRRSKKSS